MVKDSYATEVIARKDAEHLVIRLKSEITFYQQASIFDGNDFIHYSKQEIQDLNQTRADLEQICHDLRNERDSLVDELENHSKNIESLLSSQKPQELHWERLQHAYQQQLDSMQKDMSIAKANYSKLIKGRDDIISDMILLNTKNAELTQLNNDLSSKIMEREQEAKAVFAGTNFLSSSSSSTEEDNGSKVIKHKRNLSTGSIGITHSNSMSELKSAAATAITAESTKLAQRDSFNGSAAPKLFKFRRNRSNSVKKSSPSDNNTKEEMIISIPYDATHNTRSLEPVSESYLLKKEETSSTVRGGKHHFAQTKFLRPIKCEACSEKMWRVSELKCSGMKWKKKYTLIDKFRG
jgi:cupin superfamily acireductone dioxygenase involved in methionine salvage